MANEIPEIPNLNLQIPNKNNILYTSDNSLVGSRLTMEKSDSDKNNMLINKSNEWYLKNRIGKQTTESNRIIATKSLTVDGKKYYEGCGNILYGSTGNLNDIKYTTNKWTDADDKKNLDPNKYGYNTATNLISISSKEEYDNIYSEGEKYNTNSWHLENWLSVPSLDNDTTLIFTRSDSVTSADWSEMRLYYGNIIKEKLYSTNSYSSFTGTIMHVYIGSAEGNFNSDNITSSFNSGVVVLHYYDKSNKLLLSNNSFTPDSNGVFCNKLIKIPGDCTNIVGIEIKLYSGKNEVTYSQQTKLQVKIDKFNINVWEFEEIDTSYITELNNILIPRKVEGGIYKNCDIFGEKLKFNTPVRYDLTLNNAPCLKFNTDSYIKFIPDGDHNRVNYRNNGFNRVSFYYQLDETLIDDTAYIIGTNLLLNANNSNDPDNLITVEKNNNKYILKIYYKNSDIELSIINSYDITNYITSACLYNISIDYQYKRLVLKINNTNTLNELETSYWDGKTGLPEATNKQTVLGSIDESKSSLPGHYYNFTLYDSLYNNAVIYCPMSEGKGNKIINVNYKGLGDISNLYSEQDGKLSELYCSFDIEHINWGTQSNYFYNTEFGYFSELIDSENNSELFPMKYFPVFSIESNYNTQFLPGIFSKKYEPLDNGINCGDVELSSPEILGKDINVTIDNTNIIYSKTFNIQSYNTETAFKESESDSDVPSGEGLWHIYGSLTFNLPFYASDGNRIQATLNDIVSSNIKCEVKNSTDENSYTILYTILSLSNTWPYKQLDENQLDNTINIDQYWYGSITDSTKLTMSITCNLLYNGIEYNTILKESDNNTLTFDKLYFEDNIISSYQYSDKKQYIGSYNITKYNNSSDINKALYFNANKFNKINSYENISSVNTDIASVDTTVKTTVMLDLADLVKVKLDEDTNIFMATVDNIGAVNSHTISFNSEYSNQDGKVYIDSDSAWNYSTNVVDTNDIIQILPAPQNDTYVGNNLTIYRNNTDAGLNGGKINFTTTTTLPSNISELGLTNKSCTNSYSIYCPQIAVDVDSTFKLTKNNTVLNIDKDGNIEYGLIKDTTYTLNTSLESNYTFLPKNCSAELKNSSTTVLNTVVNSNTPNILTVTGETGQASNSISLDFNNNLTVNYDTNYDTNLNESSGKSNGVQTYVFNFKKPSDITIANTSIVKKEDSSTDINTTYTVSITLDNTFGYIYDKDSSIKPVSDSGETGTNGVVTTYDNITFTWTLTVSKTETNVSTGKIHIVPTNCTKEYDPTNPYTYYSLDAITVISESYGNGIYYVSNNGQEDNDGTTINGAITSITRALTKASIYSQSFKNSNSDTYILIDSDSAASYNYEIKLLSNSVKLNFDASLYIIGVSFASLNTDTKYTTGLNSNNINDFIADYTNNSNTNIVNITGVKNEKGELINTSPLLNFNKLTNGNINLYNLNFKDIYNPESSEFDSIIYLASSGSTSKFILNNCNFTNCLPDPVIKNIIKTTSDLEIKNMRFNINDNNIKTASSGSTKCSWFLAKNIIVDKSIINIQILSDSKSCHHTIFCNSGGYDYNTVLNNTYINLTGTTSYENISGIYNIQNWVRVFGPNEGTIVNTDYTYKLNYCTLIDTPNGNNNWPKLALTNSCSNKQPTRNILEITNTYLKMEYGIVGANSNIAYIGNIKLQNCIYLDNIKKMVYSWKNSKTTDISTRFTISCSYNYTIDTIVNVTTISNTENTETPYSLEIESVLIGAGISLSNKDITTDINGKNRSNTTPTIGAVEYLKENGDPITLTKGLYIDLTNGNDNNTGLSWISPKKTFKTNLDTVLSDSTFAERYVSDNKLKVYVTSGTETFTANVNENLKDCNYEIIIDGGYATTQCKSFTSSKPSVKPYTYTTINGGGTFNNNQFTNLATRRLLHSSKKIDVNSITFNNFIFENFCNTETGNIIYISNDNTKLDNLTFNICKFLDNYNNIAKIYLKADSGNIKDVSFKQCEFKNNISSDYAGVLIFDGPTTDNNSTLTIDNCTFEKCYAGYNSSYNYSDSEIDNGGVYYTTYAPKTINFSNCNFTNNRSLDNGGALDIRRTHITSYNTYEASLTIDNCIFDGNKAGDTGGSIRLNSKAFTNKDAISIEITNTKFLNGQSGIIDGNNGYGGAIYYDNTSNSGNVNQIDDTLTIENCEFDNNYSEDYGGAIWMQESPYNTTIKNCVFSNNYTKESYAGAVHSRNTVETIDVINCIFYKNRCLGSSYGGGAWYEHSLTNYAPTGSGNNKLNFYNCTFYENHSNGTGGALAFYHDAGYNNVGLYNNIFWNNTSTGNGNNIYVDQYANIISSNNIVNDPESTIIVGTSATKWDEWVWSKTSKITWNEWIGNKINKTDNYMITADPKLVPVLYEYNRNIENSTDLKSLPVCSGSSAIKAGKYIVDLIGKWFINNDNIIVITDIRGAVRPTTEETPTTKENPTIGACEYLNKLKADEFTGICINSVDKNTSKLLDEKTTINIYYPDLTAAAEEELHKNIKITQTPSEE